MYANTNSDYILRSSDGALIPPDPGNKDYIAFREWLEEGNIPDPPATVDGRPSVVLEYKAMRETYLNRLTGIAGRAAREGDNALATAADTFSQGLLDLLERPAVVAAEDADSLRAAILAEYKALVAAAKLAAPNASATFDKVSK